MTRYYFDYYDSRHPPHLDDEGLEFSDVNEARVEAICALAHHLKDEATFEDRRLKVVVRNTGGWVAQVQIWVEADYG